MALRVRGETVDEITGAVTTMRGQNARVRRRRTPIDVVGTGGDASGSPSIFRPARPSSSQAPACRSPSMAIARYRRSRARRMCWRRSASRSKWTPTRSALHRRGRHRLHVRAGASSCHEDMSARRASSSAPARIFNLLGPLSNPAGRQAPDDRHILQALGRADGAGAEESRLRRASGWCTARTASTKSPHPARPVSPRLRTARSGPSRSRPKMPARRARARSLARRRCRAQRKGIARRSQGQAGPFPRCRDSQRGGSAHCCRARPKDLKHGAMLAAKSIETGEAEGRLDRLIAVSNAVEA